MKLKTVQRAAQLTIFLTTMVFVLPAFSQNAEKTTLTLQQAVDIALQKNINVITAQNALESQQRNVTSAYGNFLPTLSANGGWSRQETHQPPSGGGSYTIGGFVIPIPVSSGISTSNSYSAGVRANMTLFDGFSNTSTLNGASDAAVSSEYNVYRTRQTVVYTAQQFYLTVLRNQSLLNVAQDNLESSKRQLERIRESNKVGAVAIADVYRQQVQTANDELALITAQNNYDNAKADLQFYLGIDVSKEYEFKDPSIAVDTVNMDVAALENQFTDFDRLVNQALKTRPDYQSALYAEGSAESGVTGARSGYFPTITASAGYSLNSSELGKLSDNKIYSWGLNFSLPLFSGFQTSTRVQQQQLALRNAEAQVDQARRQVQVDVKKAMLNYQATLKQIDVTQKNMTSASEDRRIAQEKYNLGSGTLLDLLTAVANYTKAASDRVNAVYDYLLAKQQMKYVIGTEKY
ncbi:MAG: TolC family protein [Bacteroidota bacterium]|nr:TolC family protein [Bacteroidota bacterium]